VARYREYAPCEALRGPVRAFFSFAAPAEGNLALRRIAREVRFGAGDSFCSPLFADGHVSIVFSFPRACRADGLWHLRSVAPRGEVIGPMTRVGPPSLEERSEMVGVYLRAAWASRFIRVSAGELTDRIVGLDELWGPAAVELAAALDELHEETTRIGHLESVLLHAMAKTRSPNTALDIPALAGWVTRRQGQLTVEHLANAAGVSRQHLARVFREDVGVTPKLYCRLARFQATLGDAGRGNHMDWAQVAAQRGYADQSHMIAEFRRFSSLTPERLAQQRWFHPFIERARGSR